MKSPTDASHAQSRVRWRPEWTKAAALLGGLAAVVFSPVPLCPVRFYLHAPCPGCGATRAVFAALRGDFRGSFAMHPLALIAVALALPSLAYVLRELLRTGDVRPLPRALRSVWMVYIGALIALWLARFAGMFGGPVPI